MARKKTLAISEIVLRFYVRRHLNEDHMLQLAMLYDEGVSLPPLQITTDNELIDGRHRLEALKYLNRTEVECEVVECDDFNEIVAMAMKANMGGSLPPTRDDIEFTIRQLLERGLSVNRIIDLIPLPKGMARTYITSVKAAIARAKMNQAVNDVAEGKLNPSQAAEKYEVDLESLKTELRGKRKSRVKTLKAMKASVSRDFRSLSSRNAARYKALLQQYADAEIGEKNTEAVLNHIEHCIGEVQQRLGEWRARYDALKKRNGQTA